MSWWEHDEARIKGLTITGGDLDLGWDTEWVLCIEFFTSVLESNSAHKLVGHFVMNRILRIILWLEHQVFPKIVVDLESHLMEVLGLNGFSQQRGH